MKKNTLATISERVNRIVEDMQRFQPEKIILFGSAARGDADEKSDLDIVVIAPTEKKFIQRLKEAVLAVTLPDTEQVDIFVYTPEEWENMRKNENSFYESVMRDGKVVYERSG